MILTRLEVSNFRTFRGTHAVALQPHQENGTIRPIVLFGGLNGAGKTTLFLAIKLALYGRATGEGGYSNSGYASFIRSSIHRYPCATIQPNTASIELEFQYGKLGKQFTYMVRRSWESAGTNLLEKIRIWENGEEQTSLDQNDAQGFLDELVPQAISELFFIDGEKIGHLAKDSTGDVLRTAFERIYGLDLTERLRNDLQTHLRRNVTPSLKVAVDTKSTQKEYEILQKELGDARSRLQCVETFLTEAQTRKQQLEASLRTRGGEWGEANHNYQIEADNLLRMLQEKKLALREVIAGVFPFSLGRSTMQKLLDDVAADLDMLLHRHANGTLQHFADSVRIVLDQKGKKSLDKVLSRWLKDRGVKKSVFDVSPRTLGRIEQLVNNDLASSLNRSDDLLKIIVSDSNELDILEQKLSRAPDSNALKAEFDKFARVCERIAELTSSLATLQSDIGAKLKRAIKLGAILSDRHRDSVEQCGRNQSLEYADQIRNLLKTYRETSILKRIEHLELEFNKEFNLLSRKDRRHFQVKINPQNFQVHLQSKDQGEFQTTQLSAGEKHIYAVAMLVALAKTSRRPLPLIIDSPLGRLDSEHHKKLVKNYFPHASHQVILLSTDEEIDLEAYEELSKQISRAYLIEFDDKQQESNIMKGYFANKETSNV